MLSRFVLVAVLAVGFASPVVAQLTPTPRSTNRGVQATNVEVQGTLAGAGRGNLYVLDDRNQRWQISLQNATTVHVTGTVSANALRNGIVVQLEADVDARGEVQANVSDLTVTTITRDKAVGLYPAGGNEPADNPKDAKRAKRGSASSKAIKAGKYHIIGNLTVGRNGKYSVHAGRTVVSFQLADDAKITVDASDLSLAKRGDRITVRGMMSAARPGVAMARDVKIQIGDASADNTKKPTSEDGKPRNSRPGNDPSGRN